jgi:hypothetical protein
VVEVRPRQLVDIRRALGSQLSKDAPRFFQAFLAILCRYGLAQRPVLMGGLRICRRLLAAEPIFVEASDRMGG